VTAPALVVMAAGIGSRYGGIKQIDPIGPNGEILLDYAVYDALQVGFERVVFVIRKEIESTFRAKAEPTIEKRTHVDYVLQSLDALPEGFSAPPGRVKPWGTAHAVLLCEKAVEGPFAAINADDFYGREAFAALYEFLRDVDDGASPLPICNVVYRIENTLTEHGTVSRGVCSVSPDGILENIVERKRVRPSGSGVVYLDEEDRPVELPSGCFVSMNMWGFPRSVFSELGRRFTGFLRAHRDDLTRAEALLPEVVADLIREGRAEVRVLPTESRWFGVTYPEDKDRVKRAIRALIASGAYPESLWNEPIE